MVIAMVAEEADVDGAQEGEDRGLDEADEQLHEVEDKEEVRAVEEIFPAEDVAEQTDRKREGADGDREHLDAADDQEDQRKEGIEPGGRLGLVRLVAEEIPEDELRAGVLEDDDQVGAEGNQREGDGAVKIRGERADPRGELDATVAEALFRADRADTRQQAHPVLNKDEDEEGDEQREGDRESFFAHDRLEQVAQRLEDGFEDRLALGRHDLRLAHREDDQRDNESGDGPTSGHTI